MSAGLIALVLCLTIVATGLVCILSARLEAEAERVRSAQMQAVEGGEGK